MQLYKGFDRQLCCRGFQFEVGKTYTESRARLCDTGFHACENPLDVYNYYPPATSRYCLVEIDGLTDEREDDTKRCGTSITILRELTTAEFLAACSAYEKAKLAEVFDGQSFEAQSSGYGGHAQWIKFPRA